MTSTRPGTGVIGTYWPIFTCGTEPADSTLPTSFSQLSWRPTGTGWELLARGGSATWQVTNEGRSRSERPSPFRSQLRQAAPRTSQLLEGLEGSAGWGYTSTSTERAR